MPHDDIEGEVTDITSAPLAVQHSAPALIQEDDPEKVLEVAAKRAKALMNVVNQQHLFAMIKGKKHLTVEAWQTLAVLSGVTPFTEWCRETANGWEARVTIRNSSGMDIGAAEAQCTRDEGTWRNRDSYALRSMAQTRATSKAIRSVLAFIAVLAGFEATPSDEMPDSEDSGTPKDAPPPQPPTDDSLRPLSAQEAAKLKGLMADEILIPAEISAIISEVMNNPEAGIVADIQTVGQGRLVAQKIIGKKKEVRKEIPL